VDGIVRSEIPRVSQLDPFEEELPEGEKVEKKPSPGLAGVVETESIAFPAGTGARKVFSFHITSLPRAVDVTSGPPVG
jgi:hypothetical protein